MIEKISKWIFHNISLHYACPLYAVPKPSDIGRRNCPNFCQIGAPTHPHTAVQVSAQFCHFDPNFGRKIWGGRSNFHHHPPSPGRPYSDDNARKPADIHRMRREGWRVSIAHCAKDNFKRNLARLLNIMGKKNIVQKTSLCKRQFQKESAAPFGSKCIAWLASCWILPSE